MGTGIQNRAAHCLPNGKQQKAGRGVAGPPTGKGGREVGAGVAQLPLRDATQLYAKKKKDVKFMNMNEADGDVNGDSDSDCDANVLGQLLLLLLLLHKLHVVSPPPRLGHKTVKRNWAKCH